LKAVYYIVFFLLISSSVVRAGWFSTIRQKQDLNTQTPGAEFGIAQYPLAIYLAEQTERLTQTRTDSWLLAKVFQTESRIEDVANFFKKQAAEENRTASKSVQWLMWNNWNIRLYKVSQLPAAFGLESKLPSGAEEVKATFGVIVLSDSLIRINLLSPYPIKDNQKFASGTLISLIREQLPEKTLSDENQKKTDKEKIYLPKEVDQRVTILSKPSPLMPEPWGRSIVSLRVVFSSTGKVKNVEVIGGGPRDRFARAAMEAARKIKFAPAIKDGRAVSQRGLLEYQFGESVSPELPVPKVQLTTRRRPE
jgi:TonB family protein